MVNKLRTAVVKAIRAHGRTVAFLSIELAGSGAVLDGIAHYSRPIALIIGGIGAVVAVERRPKSAAEQVAELKKLVEAAKLEKQS